MLHVNQFRDLIQRVLKTSGLPRKEEAINLLLGTAAQESGFGTYLRQIRGPALGAFQMEPETALYVIVEAEKRFPGIFSPWSSVSPQMLEWDLRFSVILARINYLLKPGSIPVGTEGQAYYWKTWWNTSAGAGTVDQYLKNWERYVA